MNELKPCPFCGKAPKVLQRPDTLDGYFCAISCFCGGYSARAHQAAIDADEAEAYEKAAQRWNRRVEPANAPLMLDELRGMIGNPVWVTHKDGSGGRWGIANQYDIGLCADINAGTAYWFDDYCGTIAYRHKPEGSKN